MGKEIAIPVPRRAGNLNGPTYQLNCELAELAA